MKTILSFEVEMEKGYCMFSLDKSVDTSIFSYIPTRGIFTFSLLWSVFPLCGVPFEMGPISTLDRKTHATVRQVYAGKMELTITTVH